MFQICPHVFMKTINFDQIEKIADKNNKVDNFMNCY